jgi:hypothetical protein
MTTNPAWEMAPENPIPEVIRDTLTPTISRLVAGLPMHELHVIVKEAMACEDALEREIETLERELNIKSSDSKKSSKEEDASPLSPLKEPVMNPIPLLPIVYQPNGGDVNYLASVDDILDTEFTPPDRYFTISALLGRLREPLKLPHPPNSRLHAHPLSIKTKKNDPVSEERKKQLALEKQQALLALDKDVAYHADHPDTTALLALYKKISGHRTSAVFRKPVNPLEGESRKGVGDGDAVVTLFLPTRSTLSH